MFVDQTKVYVKGGDGGNGILGWPTRDQINSPYGKKRGRKIHTGTDIDGEKGPDFPLDIKCIKGGVKILGVNIEN